MENSKIEEKNLSWIITRIIVAGSFGTVFGSATGAGIVTKIATGGVFLTGFALLLGASSFQVGLISAIPLLCFPAQIISSYIAEKRGKRKETWFNLELPRRLMWILIALIPFLISSSLKELRIFTLIFILFISNLLFSFSFPLWFSWIADIIPENIGGRFWGKRTAILGSVGIVFSMLFAKFLDYFPKEDSVKGFIGFAVVFIIGVICGEIDIFLHRKVPEPQMKIQQEKIAFLELLKKPFTHRNFARYIVFVSTWSFAAQFIAPFVNVFYIEKLNISYFIISFLFNVSGAVAVLTATPWGNIADRFSHKKVMDICLKIALFLPFVYVFVTSLNYIYILTPLYVLSGFIGSGYTVTNTNLLLSISPRENKSMYIAVFYSIVGLFSAIAPLIAGWILELTKNISFNIKSIQLINFHIVFILGGIFHIISYLFFLQIDEKKENNSI